MSEPLLPELEAERDRLYARLAAVGDFRRGSLNEMRRKCGKPNCACAEPDHPGHGPQFLEPDAQGTGDGRPVTWRQPSWRKPGGRWRSTAVPGPAGRSRR